MPIQRDPRLLLDFHGHDDAGVFRVREDFALVQTVDFFTPIVDDPEDFGAISAANALSDVYAMGATPLTALGIVCFPYRELEADILAAICAGGAKKIAESDAMVLGGHSVEDAEIKFGYAITASVKPDAFWRNNTPEPGDALILTKPLGTGLLTTAVKQDQLPESVLQEPIASMKRLNKTASECAANFSIHAATDITGFGLLGHLFEMLKERHLGAEITVDSLPLFDSVWDAVAAGSLTRAHRTNKDYIGQYAPHACATFDRFSPILLDPQTSGGLLFSLDPDQAQALIKACEIAGFAAHDIGRVIQNPGFRCK